MTKTDRYDLTRGSIFHKMLLLGLPIMGTQLVQMAYNLADMFWLGRLGSAAVAASGTVGIYMWLALALHNYGVKGAEIGVSQSLGRGDGAAARGYTRSAISLAFFLGLLFGAVLLVFAAPLIGFFDIREAGVVADAQLYLRIVAIGIPFSYVSGAVVGCFNGSGNAVIPFAINAACLVLNILLDPLFIFTFSLGIAGAAWATVLAQALATLLLLLALRGYRHRAFAGFKPLALPKAAHLRQIFRWATPIAVESFLFTFLIMIISRFVAGFGAGAIATQRIGSQVESLSWLVAGGFASALAAFVGQNYGARRWGRIHKGFGVATVVACVWGVLITGILLLGTRPIFALFLPGETAVIAMGAQYLRILAACQLLACLENIAAGAFRGLGKTIPPSLISALCNICRVVAAWVLSAGPLGLNGIWWAISVGAAVRGLATFICYLALARRLPKRDEAVVGEAGQ